MSSSEPAETLPTTGLVAGKYEIVRLIGRGGMGSVWEAKHNSLGTRVAIKFVEVAQAQNEEARARFQNEARAAASIQSKHAIKVYDHGLLEDGRPYIVMELLVGEALDHRLDLLGRLPIQDVARMVQQIARALQQAHEAGITHRDLKPENIFLERSEGDDQDLAKVLDFGIAKMRDPAHTMPVSSSTKTGVLMGTPFYMSPEQARGMKTVDHRSDLWSLAVIVFRCVTGQLPFDGESLGDLLVKICASPVPPPSSVLPGLSPQFDAWMARALDREPANRFQTATDLAESLAMVAGVSVRLSSRRSNDFPLGPPTEQTPNPSIHGSAAQGPYMTPNGMNALPYGPQPTPRLPSTDTYPVQSSPRAPDVMRQPIPMGTSSPFTAEPAEIPMRGSVGAVTLSIMAAALLVGAAGGTYWWMHRGAGGRTDVSAASTTEPSQAHPTPTPPPPATSTVHEPTPISTVDSLTLAHPTAAASAEPATMNKHPGNTAHPGGNAPPHYGTKPSPPPVSTAVSLPRATNHPTPPPTNASDPGY